MVKDVIDFLIQQDPQVGNAVQAEYDRQRRNIELIASENFVSPAVLAAASSVLTNKYAEGYPGKRYYGGCECVDVVEDIARDRAKALFGADHANVQPHSGASANYAVYQALCNVGDTVMGMNLDNGGHLTHGSPVNYSGINYKIVPYGVDPKTHRIDYDQVRDLAKQCKPKMIIAGASAYPRVIDFKTFAEMCIVRQMITAIQNATRMKHIPLNNYISLSRPVGNEEYERTMMDVIPSHARDNPEDMLIVRESVDSMIRKIKERLTELEYKTLTLFIDGKSYQEIADMLGCNKKTIDNALQRIKRKVRHIMEEEGRDCP